MSSQSSAGAAQAGPAAPVELPGGLGPFPALTAPFASVRALQWLSRGIIAWLALGALSVLLVGANRPARPHFLSTQAIQLTQAHSRPSRVPGFPAVGFRIIDERRGGIGRQGCALVADTPARRMAAMVGRRNLAGYDAVLFRFSRNSVVPLVATGVPIPVSIAWFDGSGVFIAQTNHAACPAMCLPILLRVPYRYALETPKGELARLGVGPHTVLLVGGTCG